MPDPFKPPPRHHAIAAAEGSAAVQAWIALLPDWQADRATRIDATLTRTLPSLRKAVKWHGAWYGMPGQGWIAALNTFKSYLKLTFFDGCLLDPVPPDALAQKPAAAWNIRQDMALDADLIARWAVQAARLPGLFKA